MPTAFSLSNAFSVLGLWLDIAAAYLTYLGVKTSIESARHLEEPILTPLTPNIDDIGSKD